MVRLGQLTLLDTYTVGDLFSGFGNFSIAAEQVPGVTVVFAANHDPDAVDWHRRHHPHTHHECQDLQQFDFSLMPNVDLLLASPACQGHSTAGQPAQVGTGGNGRVDPVKLAKKHQADRATAWAVIAACDTQRPASLIVENVPKFAQWALFGPWLDCLRTLGYHVRVHHLDASDFGVAQARRRCVVTAALAGPVELEPTTAHAAPWRTIGDCLEPRSEVSWVPIASRRPNVQRLIAKAIADTGSHQCMINNVGGGVRGRDWSDVFPTVTTRSYGQFIIIDGELCRVTTSREIARAQGTPDTYSFPANRKIAGRLIGNAVPVSMAAAAVEQIKAAA